MLAAIMFFMKETPRRHEVEALAKERAKELFQRLAKLPQKALSPLRADLQGYRRESRYIPPHTVIANLLKQWKTKAASKDPMSLREEQENGKEEKEEGVQDPLDGDVSAVNPEVAHLKTEAQKHKDVVDKMLAAALEKETKACQVAAETIMAVALEKDRRLRDQLRAEAEAEAEAEGVGTSVKAESDDAIGPACGKESPSSVEPYLSASDSAKAVLQRLAGPLKRRFSGESAPPAESSTQADTETNAMLISPAPAVAPLIPSLPRPLLG